MIDQIMKKNCNGHVPRKRQVMGSVIRVSFDTFGIEMAFQSLVSETPFLLFPSAYGWFKIDGDKRFSLDG
jgi:hypothetical protein